MLSIVTIYSSTGTILGVILILFKNYSSISNKCNFMAFFVHQFEHVFTIPKGKGEVER